MEDIRCITFTTIKAVSVDVMLGTPSRNQILALAVAGGQLSRSCAFIKCNFYGSAGCQALKIYSRPLANIHADVPLLI